MTSTILVISAVFGLLVPSAPAVAQTEGTGTVPTVLERASELASSDRIDASFSLVLDYARTHEADYTLPVQFSRALGEMGLHPRAIEFLEQVLVVQPGNSIAAMELGVLLVAYRRHEEAIPVLRLITPEAGGRYGSAQLNLGSSLLAVGRLDEARTIYQGVLDRQPNSAFAISGLCRISLGEGDAAACQRVFESVPENTRTVGVLANTAVLLAYGSGDIARCDAAIATANNSEGLGVISGAIPVLLALEAGDGDRAERSLEAHRHVFVDGEFTALRALVEHVKGNDDEARRLLQTAVEHNSLFDSPTDVGRVLLWGPTTREMLSGLRSTVADSEVGQAPTAGVTPAEPSSKASGCCRSTIAGTRYGGAFVSCSVFFAVLIFLKKSRCIQLRVGSRRADPTGAGRHD